MREFAKDFYQSQAWKETRKAYAASVGGLCERCRAKGLIVPAEIVHHKIHLTPDNINDPGITLSWSNLEALCRQCHGDAHKRLRKRYTINSNGEITARD